VVEPCIRHSQATANHKSVLPNRVGDVYAWLEMATFGRLGCARVDGMRRRFGSSLLALSLISGGCAGANSPHIGLSIIQVEESHLGNIRKVDYLARGFLVSGQRDIAGFGYYVYLLFRPEATENQKLIAAQEFLKQYDLAGYRRLDHTIDFKSLALLVAPIVRPVLPLGERELVGNYDGARAAVISHEVERVHPGVPAVALVAYPEPIERGMRLDKGPLLVTDACGSVRDVRTKFARLHSVLVTGKRDGVVLQFASLLGTLFTTFSTVPCQ